jgi:branched-chain amino acid transport system ATP-binding protein
MGNPIRIGGEMRENATLLKAEKLSAGYHGVAAIRELDLEVRAGEMILLAGPNGAGKSTTLMTLAGAIKPLSGDVLVDGTSCRLPVYRRCQQKLGLITEERTIFPSLTVTENLRLGQGDPEIAFGHFPELEKRARVRAGLLSGGEQQMLSLARVLAASPRTILADELSMGLAPIIVQRLLAALRQAAADGAGVLVVEQHVHMALPIVDRAYLMRRGRIEGAGTSAELRSDESLLTSLYL